MLIILMVKTTIIYKNKCYELDECRVVTLIEDDKEVRYTECSYHGQTYRALTLPAIRSWLERIIENELKQRK